MRSPASIAAWLILALLAGASGCDTMGTGAPGPLDDMDMTSNGDSSSNDANSSNGDADSNDDADTSDDGDADTNGTDNPPPDGPRLLVTNGVRSDIMTFARNSSLDGDVAPLLHTTGSLVLEPIAMGFNSAGQLVRLRTVALGGGSSAGEIEVYDDPAALDGDAQPNRTVEGAATQMNGVLHMAVDAQRDLAYVSQGATVLVFENTSQPSFDDAAAPSRSFTSPDFAGQFNSFALQLVLAGNDEMYVLASQQRIVVIAGASAASGSVAASRILLGLAPWKFCYDPANDRLYIVQLVGTVNGNVETIVRVDNASMKSGMVTPDATISIPGAATTLDLAIDGDGVLYLLDSNRRVLIYDDVATLSGMVAPTRTLAGTATKLDGPTALTLLD